MSPKVSYSEQLLDPRWQKKRLEIMQRDNFTCQACFNNKNTLSVHHRYYVPQRMAWEYPDCCLITLCEQCHKSKCDLTPWEKWLSVLEGPHPEFVAIVNEFIEKHREPKGDLKPTSMQVSLWDFLNEVSGNKHRSIKRAIMGN